MSDLSISQKFNMPIATPQFRSGNTNPINPTTKENKGLSTGAKVAIGTGLVALASYGIYVATRGKVKPKATPPATTNNPVQEIKELAVNTFKEAGNKFVKGKAVMADGTNYTGKIVSEGKDGSKVVMEYVDGVLQKSTKTAKDGTKVFDKAYTWAEDGLIKEVKKNGETILDENKLIEIYKKANTHLIKNNPNNLANSHPEVINSLEEIYADVGKIDNESFIKAVKDRIKSTLHCYGYDISDKGKIIEKFELKNGLINLRKQNKELCNDFKESIDTSLHKRFTSILNDYQKLDNFLTDKSIKNNIAAKDLKRKLAIHLDSFGYKFSDCAPTTEGMYEVLGRGAIGAPEVVCRPILDQTGRCVSQGRVWLPD